MEKELLRLEDLTVEVEENIVLKEVDLTVGRQEIHAILGPNAVGKSTLLAAIMGLPHVKVTKGRIIFEDKDITFMPLTERSKLGIALAYQIPPELVGVKLGVLAREIAKRFGTEEILENLIHYLRLESLIERDAFKGFSGGEKKRAELFLTLLQKPKLALLDEPDSGVDLESLKLISDTIMYLVNELGSTVILVSHTGEILERLGNVKSHILLDGKITYTGDVNRALALIREKGFREAVSQLTRR